jgi:hypothetical protein
MAAPTDDGHPVSLRQLQRYVNKIDPLLALWNESIDPQATREYWIVIPRLIAIIRHAEKMNVPNALHETHHLLLGALTHGAEAYGESQTGRSVVTIANARTGAKSLMSAFRAELNRQLTTAQANTPEA